MVREDGSPDPETAGRCVTSALQKGLLLLAGGRHGNVISLSPPFDVSGEDVHYLARSLAEILRTP
jgi:4-aminobutyrate aminotransferase-like enzyme